MTAVRRQIQVNGLTSSTHHRHWNPQNTGCGLCLVSNDLVGRVESMDEDLLHMLDMVGATEEDRNRVNLGTKKNASPKWNNRTLEYFKALRPEMRSRLHQIYKIDFEMFGYSADKYLNV